jgi:endonuclease/exonuclease/phosphatase family metal-dependent hydrolase
MILLAWFLSVSKTGTRVEGCGRGCATKQERQDGTLRVMTLNVLHGYPTFAHLRRRFELIAREIRHHDADIVCLQEVPWTWHLGSGAQYLGEQTGLNYLYVRANGNRHAILFEEGVAILSRYALREPRFIELEPRAGFFEHRVALHATAMTPWGAMRVFVTHLTPTDPNLNSAQTTALQAFVEQTGNGLAIVAGDLNATEDLPHIQALSSAWLDVYRAVNPDDAGMTCCIKNLISSPRVRLKKRIDYIFLMAQATLEAEVLETRRVFDQPFQVVQDWQWVSDHVGLLTVLRLTPRGVRVE